MREFTLAELADRLGGRVEGDGTIVVRGIKPLAEATADDVAVVSTRAELARLKHAAVGAAVVAEAAATDKRPLLRVTAPRLALARLLELFHGVPREVTGVDPRAFVAPDAVIGRDSNVGPGAFVGHGAVLGERVDVHAGAYVGDRVRIGDDSVIFPRATLYPDTAIGRRARIHSGAVIGADGFGYTLGPSAELYKIPQVGCVAIGDDVEIGANTTIDRATMSRTVIGNGVKIDNLVQVAHNVEIGDHACLVAQSGIAGSSRLGRYVILAAGAGLADHVTVGDGARIGARAGVHKDVPAGTDVMGTPAIPGKQFLKSYPLLPQLPELRRRLKALEARCAELEAELRALRRA